MIKVICLGKIKEKYLQEAVNDYVTRIRKYHKLEIVELEDEVNLDSKKILENEAKKIKKHLGEKDYVIVLTSEGEQVDSPALAKQIDSFLPYYPVITFVIGASLGIDEEIKKSANWHLSFSKLTYPHQLFRVIFLEQLYRSFKIINNESYHK